MRRLVLCLATAAGSLLSGTVCSQTAGDWPMWRHDAGRTAASPQPLPDRLQPQWTRVYSPRAQVWDDPLNNDMMPYDRVFEPVVLNGRMFVGFNDQDKVVALDVRDGSLLWTFHTGGPVRLPPVAWRENLYFTSDDGYLYCVEAATGDLRWRILGGPASTHVLGNQRLISAWPARGGPVVADGQVFFAASIWPFMGTFIYALDAQSGEVAWVNDGSSADYILQPHSAPSFAGVAPQGALVVSGDYLIVPGGRSVPAVFQRRTGELVHFELNAGGKGNGGSSVMARGNEFFLHTRGRGVRAFELKTGKKTEFMTNEPVLSDKFLYTFKTTERKDDDGRQQRICAYGYDKQLAWRIAADASGDLIQAGNRLYAAGPDQIAAIELPATPNDQPTVAWTLPVDGKVQRLLAGADRLFAVTDDGRILAFGAEPGQLQPIETSEEPLRVAKEALARADDLLRQVATTEGYALWYGVEDEQLLQALVDRSNLQVIAVDPDEQRVERLRKTFDRAGLYGRRVTVHHGVPRALRPGPPRPFGAPPYLANLVLVGNQLASTLVTDQTTLARIYRSVRPYGGSLVPLVSDQQRRAFSQSIARARLPKAELVQDSTFLAVRRVGALKGAGDWTHQYGNIANTVKSNDELVMSPLGLLWFGGSSNLDVLPRHGHGPPEQVIGGRLFIEGMNSLSCRDVYTGRVLWRHEFPDLGTFDIYYDGTYKDTPLDTAYNQVHIPGANGRGTNYVATEQEVYIVAGPICYVLDAKNGETLREIEMPSDAAGASRSWGFVGVYGDMLLGGAGFADYRKRYELAFAESDGQLKDSKKGFGSKSFDVSASGGLVAFDRHTGQVLWELPARYSFLHNGIVAGDGKVFCLDKLPKPIEEKLKRRGELPPDGYRIVVVDAQTGQSVWEVDEGIFGTWLSYSEEHHLLLQAGAQASDRLSTEVGAGMAVYEGDTGDVRWQDIYRAYSGPCILYHSTILTNSNSYQFSAGAFSLLDGTPKMINNPITGEPQPWQLCRAYGCNSIVASEKLLTFRSGAAGFYDIDSLSGTGNLGGFKSGCTSNLIVANGVLNAPDYTRTCSCGYQNQTSLALIHMPPLDIWTVNHMASLAKKGSHVRRIGINFGAPGDRMGPDRTLWLEYPFVGGQSATLAINVDGEQPTYWRRNSLIMRGSGLRWVAASGVENVQSISIPLKVGPSDEPGLTFSISHRDDDAEEQPNGSVSLTSSDLELVSDNNAQVVGIRFKGVRIPRGTTIKQAAIQFTCDETSSDATELVIRAEDSAKAARFVKARRNISSRSLTSARVSWTPDPWTEAGAAEAEQRTPDLAPLVQSVIDRPDWRPGNPLAFVITGKGKRVAAAYEEKETAARLIIDADVPAPKVPEMPPVPFTVRLHFAEPHELAVGERVFDIQLQGLLVDHGVDIVQQAGGPRRILIKEYRGVMIGDALQIDLQAQSGQPLICGAEIVRQQQRTVRLRRQPP